MYCKRKIALFLMLMFLIAPMASLAIGDLEEVSTTYSRSDKDYGPGIHNISTSQTYEIVKILEGATVIVKAGITLSAKKIQFEGGSMKILGNILIENIPNHEAAYFGGNGKFLEMHKGSTLTLRGPISADSREESQGGCAEVDFTAEDYILIKGGSIEAYGASGTGPSMGPWAINGLSGHESGGGTVNITLKTKGWSALNYITIEDKANLVAQGGSAGHAPDAQGTTSGGFSDGGIVSNHVGAGGDAKIVVESRNVQIKSSTLTAKGGNGGNAGDGAQGAGSTGGAGGGYGGGSPVSGSSGNGVAVIDRVGSGGWASIYVNASGSAEVKNSDIKGYGGNGGTAGNGGNGGMNWNDGGGGGGGYGGGGGATGSGNDVVGEGTMVMDYVGAGGFVNFGFNAMESIALTGTTSLQMKGGNGGSGGTGGIGTNGGGGGGGGYGGGGGGWGWGSVPGGSTLVAGRVGDGGDVKIIWTEDTLSVGETVSFSTLGGTKGNAPTSKGGTSSYGDGGAGAGKSTVDGYVRYEIPQTVPLPLSPAEGEIVDQAPTFRWSLVHKTGPAPEYSATNYLLQVDDNATFDSPEIDEELGSKTNQFEGIDLPGGIFYWRVKAVYNAPTQEAGWSAVRQFYYNTDPNMTKDIPVQILQEDQNKTHALNLKEFFTDDLYPDDLVFEMAPDENPNVQHFIYVTLEGDQNEWVNINVTPNFYGQEEFRFIARDLGGREKQSNKMFVTVLPVNDPPKIGYLEDILVTEDEVFTLPFGDTSILTDQESWHDTLPTGDPPVFQLNNIDVSTDSDYITVVKDSNAYPPTIDLVLLYTDEVGSEYVNVTVFDGKDSTTRGFMVNVSPENDWPVINEIPDIRIPEDVPKTIDLKAYTIDEEDGATGLKWFITIRDSTKLTAKIEEGGLLRVIPKPEVSGGTVIYLTAEDSQGERAKGQINVSIMPVNDPPRLTISELCVPKGIEFTIDMMEIMEDVDSNIQDLLIVNASLANGTVPVQIQDTSLIFNYPVDTPLNNDTLVLDSSDGDNSTSENLTIVLGFAPVLKNIKKISFTSDQEFTLDLHKLLSDEDTELSDLEVEVEGYDPSLFSTAFDPNSGEMRFKSYGSGKDTFKIIVTDELGFTAEQEVKIEISEPTFSSYLNNHPEALAGIVAMIIIILVVVLIGLSRAKGIPFKSLKKKKDVEDGEEEAEKEVKTEGPPPPPSGWQEGVGWTGQPGEEPQEGAPPAEGTPPTEGTVSKPPETGAPGPKLVPPPKAATPVEEKPAEPERLCPKCREPVEADFKVCPNCDTPLDRDARRELRRKRRERRMKRVVEDDEEDLDEEEEHLDDEEGEVKDEEGDDTGHKCPHCGDPIEPDFIKCPSCNESLEDLKK
jgi:hypothetical protein